MRVLVTQLFYFDLILNNDQEGASEVVVGEAPPKKPSKLHKIRRKGSITKQEVAQ